MSEFKLQVLASDLLRILGTPNSALKPETLVDCFQKDINESKAGTGIQIAGQSNAYAIRDSLTADQSGPFLAKYTDLKNKNVDNLEPFVDLLGKLAQENKIKNLLAESSKQAKIVPRRSGDYTTDDLPALRSRVKQATNEKQLDQSSSAGSRFDSTSVTSLRTPAPCSWVQRRPSMSFDFSTHSLPVRVPQIHNLSTESLENALIEELLSVLIGRPGMYIQPEPLQDPYGQREFTVHECIPLSLREMVKQILPAASSYSIIQRYAEEKMRFEFGQVNNALAEEMGNILYQYTVNITQLETLFLEGNLNIQKLWFHIQKSLPTLRATATIAFTISKSGAMGGKVLSVLHENIARSLGDSGTQDRCVNLMTAASYPYMQMLGMWIYRGIISDPIGEFLVEDYEVIQKEKMPVDYSADYWDKKYAIRKERVPAFLSSAADSILKTGKYLNVIRQCGKPVKGKVKPIQFSIDEHQYMDVINETFQTASETLLDLVVKENDLLGRLRSVKHYFLLDQGDFIVTFLTLCEKELSKDISKIIHSRLEALMELALRMSSANRDPYKEDLRSELLPHDLLYQMSKILMYNTKNDKNSISNENLNVESSSDKQPLLGIQSFSFGYEVQWPLSLVLNRKSLARYQMIFRHLFYCKFVERMLCQVWRSNKVAKKFAYVYAQGYRHAFALRQRMVHCVQNLEYHMMVEVIEPHWVSFKRIISRVKNVDEILESHFDFLDNCLKECMLTITPILSIIIKVLEICLNFSKFMQNDTAFQSSDNAFGNISLLFGRKDNCTMADTVASSNDTVLTFNEQIHAFDIDFSTALMKLLDEINDRNGVTYDNDRLFNLLYRLDFNSFYTGHFIGMGLK